MTVEPLWRMNWPQELRPLPRPIQQQIDDGFWSPDTRLQAIVDALEDNDTLHDEAAVALVLDLLDGNADAIGAIELGPSRHEWIDIVIDAVRTSLLDALTKEDSE